MKADLLVRELIAMIRRRPAMYMGTKSIRHLETYLAGAMGGIKVALAITGQNADGVGEELVEFRAWLRERSAKNGYWLDIMIGETGGDEDAATDRFFVLWDEFLRAREAAEQT